jgi:hypothetical protein
VSDSEIYQLQRVIAEIIIKFKNSKYRLETWIKSESKIYDLDVKSVVRYGNVELRVIDSWLKDPGRLYDAARKMAKEINLNKYKLIDMQEGYTKWYSADDLQFNLQALMTNAGFYMPKDENLAGYEIGLWCENYYKELKKSAVFIFPPAYPFYFYSLKSLIYTGNFTEDISFPSPENFYRLIAGKKILLVTPFSEEISNIYQSKKIFKLYKNIDIQNFIIETIQSPMSIYPNRNNESWSETFHEMKIKIDGYLQSGGYDIFMASSGCYGLPLCGYVREKYNIRTLYYGNHINTLFGILQKCSNDFYINERINENWIKSQLGEKYPTIKNVDNGRYT